MNGSNIKHEVVRDIPYVILLRMGDGEVIKIMTMGLTYVEEYGGKEFVVFRMMSPKITKTHKDHQIFEDMMPMEDV